MPKYCFILGKTPLLSVSEIFRLGELWAVDFKIIDLSSEIMVVETNKLNAEKWQSRLGGTVKISEVISEFRELGDLMEFLDLDNVLSLFNQSEKKIVFGFSLYGQRIMPLAANFNTIGLNLKKDLQQRDFNARFIYKPNAPLSSVQIGRNKLIEKGAEILIISGIYGFYIAKTLTIQDYQDYSQKDYGRPQRDMHTGLLPPKLAKIMINLAEVKSDDTILDPFCGSGTVLQEALLAGFQNVIGSDIDSKAVWQTEENLKWLVENYKLARAKYKLIVSDVKNLQAKIAKNSVDTIVTEPFLGPALKGKPTTEKIKKIINELESLYLAAFENFKTILKPHGRIVAVLPLFKTGDGIFTLRILETLEQRGFFRINPIPERASLFAKIGPTARGSMIYQRPDQKVEREIFIFEKNE